MPYLTPDEIPEERDCRALSIPASSDWLAIVSGALTELTKEWNWEQGGSITVDEAVTAMQAMIDAYYEGCASCTLPGGYRIIRVNASGHVEELGDDGEWQEPTGDYYIPPPSARTEGSEADQKCLAAKNAANVLALLYESLSESWGEELSTDDTIIAFIAAIVGAVGFAFAPIVWALVIPIIAVFIAVSKLLEFLTADLWDEAFTNQMTCMLLECATNTDGVVTFGWDCLNDKFNEQANSFALTDQQLRLYIQIGYIMQFIGGTDGLNLAGRTTAITDDDCSDCAECVFPVAPSGYVYGWEVFASDGQTVTFTATGEWNAGDGDVDPVSPDGTDIYGPAPGSYTLPGGQVYGLIAKFTPTGSWFTVGSGPVDYTATEDGSFFFRMNIPDYSGSSEAITVTMTGGGCTPG